MCFEAPRQGDSESSRPAPGSSTGISPLGSLPGPLRSDKAPAIRPTREIAGLLSAEGSSGATLVLVRDPGHSEPDAPHRAAEPSGRLRESPWSPDEVSDYIALSLGAVSGGP